MATGYFALVLHAHLPFVRHPEDPTVMEERWLQEAIVGTYLPLLQTFEGLAGDHVPFRCTVSLSAPLITMLSDDLLKVRFAEHLDALIALGEKEIERTRPEPHYQRLATMYRDRFASLRHTWRCHDGDLIRAFRTLQDAGYLEVITSTATHPFFPLMDRNWAAMRAQVHTAANLYEKHFGRRSLGMWLGECGYVPGVDELLREAAVRYFLVDTHSILYADRRPAFGVYAPVYCPTGVAAFGRDTESSEQVWSAKHGYPGDPQYRDFYRDIGFDLPLDYIGPHIHPEGHRMYTGFKYQAITHDKLHDKWVYDPDVARGKAGLHASHFRGNMEKQVQRLSHEIAGLSAQGRPPLIVSPYDAELYGHWWYEGPLFLGDLFRQMHFDQSVVEPITPGQYLERHPSNQRATPAASSWGLKGYNEQWLNETNAWTYRHVHAAGERMVSLARQNAGGRGGPLVHRALNQAARELMLAQSSDWTFIMSTGTTVPYATRRFNEHIVRFNRLADELGRGQIDEVNLAAVEARDNIFPDVDYRLYAT
jgi:1,4-alpha-glucan branching enzyme